MGGLGLLLAVAGCGQELLAGGQTEGEVSAVVTDDPGSAAPGRQASRRAGGPEPTLFGGTIVVPQGTVEVDGSVTIVRQDGAEVPLSSGSSSVSVRIAAADSGTLARRRVSAGSHTRARITFTRVEANVTGGLTVGPGIQVTGRVRVALTEPLVLEVPVQLEVREDGIHRLVIDLNASDWLMAVDPVLRTVPAATFRSKVQVRVR